MQKSISSKEKAEKLVKWIKNYAEQAKAKALVVGISGGIDSALVSTLCAMTGIETTLVSVQILQPEDNIPLAKEHLQRAQRHVNDLVIRFANVSYSFVEMSSVFDEYRVNIEHSFSDDLALANSRSRLRMTALYQVATCVKGLVVGTGNKVEDFGVGFFTKYGDGGVDISPIACLTKTEVREVAKEVGVIEEILNATPTDGLWADGRTDEDQLGATYPELEWAMEWYEKNPGLMYIDNQEIYADNSLTTRELQVLSIYKTFHRKNAHKMRPIPIPDLYA